MQWVTDWVTVSVTCSYKYSDIKYTTVLALRATVNLMLILKVWVTVRLRFTELDLVMLLMLQLLC